MKRHPSLRKLSDDHHGGLVQARRFRRVTVVEGESAREAARAFLRFWEEDTSPHFREEEELLLAVFARHGGDLGAQPIQEMVAGDPAGGHPANTDPFHQEAGRAAGRG